jgi:hypothetical protein
MLQPSCYCVSNERCDTHATTNTATIATATATAIVLQLIPSVEEPPEEPQHRLMRILVRCAGLNTAPLSGKKRANTLIAQFPTVTKLSCERAVTRQSSSSAMLAVHPGSRARGSASSQGGRGPPVRTVKYYSSKGAKKAGGSSAAKGAAKKKKAPAPVRSDV